jgi:hypothetical protein
VVGLGGLLLALTVAITSATVPELTLSAQEAAPNEEVGVDGRGFGDCLPAEPTGAPPTPEGTAVDQVPVVPTAPTVVAVHWESLGDRQLLDEVVLEPDGSFSTTIAVPADAGAEPYLVSASCSPGSGFDEISESAVLVVVTPPGPITSNPPPTSPRTTAPIGTGPIGTGPIGTGPAPVPPPTPVLTPAPESGGTASPQVEPAASEGLPAAFVSILVLALGLFWLARAVRSRQRSRGHSRGHSVSAVAAPAPPGALDVRPLGPERTVALRVALRAGPGVLTVHGTKE